MPETPVDTSDTTVERIAAQLVKETDRYNRPIQHVLMTDASSLLRALIAERKQLRLALSDAREDAHRFSSNVIFED